MAAILTPTEQEWEVLKKFLNQIRQSCVAGQGAIIITPEIQKKMNEFGKHAVIGSLPDYDFGGAPDFNIDVVEPDADSGDWFEGLTAAQFSDALENCELDIKLEGAAIAYGFKPSWHKG